LLRAAAEELVEVGELEVAAVARRAGVSVGLPYRYFGTRSGLLIAVVDDFYDRLGKACALRAYHAPTWARSLLPGRALLMPPAFPSAPRTPQGRGLARAGWS
jgi:AcrR family transcriptional regulator